MNRRLLLLFLVGFVVLVGLALGANEIRSEPVESISAKWASSPHADADSVSFTKWSDGQGGLIPASCARCHSAHGFRDYLGDDGTTAGVVDKEAPVGTTVTCLACHNEPAHALSQVQFPSGAMLDVWESESRCLVCHQGRRSGEDVAEAIVELDDDVVASDLGFINIHYAVAAATHGGSDGGAAYEYPGQAYAGRYPHVSQRDTCAECHDPHSLRVDADACSPCHLNVVDGADLPAIRTSSVDYDGDGDAAEGVAEEIATLHAMVLQGLEEYADDVIGTPLSYIDGSPYFVVDGADDAAYDRWTPRLMRAAYNYHLVAQDRGGYTHNAPYVIQVLYDTIADLAERTSLSVDGLTRPAVGEGK